MCKNNNSKKIHKIMKVFLILLLVWSSFTHLSAGCFSCQSITTRFSLYETPLLKRLRELHALRKDKSSTLKERLKQIHESRYPSPEQKPPSAAGMEFESVNPLGNSEIGSLNNEERGDLAKISQVLTPLIIAYPQDSLIPKGNVPHDIELEYLQMINIFLLKLKTAYEKLPEPVQNYFKTKQFLQHPIGSRFNKLFSTVKNYVADKKSSYKAIKSPDTIVKELKKLAGSLDKLIEWLDQLLYPNATKSNT